MAGHWRPQLLMHMCRVPPNDLQLQGCFSEPRYLTSLTSTARPTTMLHPPFCADAKEPPVELQPLMRVALELCCVARDMDVVTPCVLQEVTFILKSLHKVRLSV